MATEREPTTPGPAGDAVTEDAGPAGPVRSWAGRKAVWATYFAFTGLIVVPASVGIIRTLLRGGPLNPSADEPAVAVTPIDPATPEPRALRGCHADLDGLYHQLRERVVTLGMAVRNLDPAQIDRWQRWSSSWRAELDALAVRCSLLPRPAHPALAALADAHDILRNAEARYLAALAELARDESRSLKAAAEALKVARTRLGAAAPTPAVPAPETAAPAPATAAPTSP